MNPNQPISLQPINEGTSVEDACRILFKNLEDLNQLQTDKFLELATEMLGQEHVDNKRNQLTNQTLTLEDLLRFIAKEPATEITGIVNMNASLTNKETLQLNEQESAELDSPQPIQSPLGVFSQKSKINMLKDEVQRQTEINGNFEINMANFAKENRKFKAIISKCEKCSSALNEINSKDEDSSDEDAEHHNKDQEFNLKIKQLETEVSDLSNKNEKLKQVIAAVEDKLESQGNNNHELEEKIQVILRANGELENQLLAFPEG